MKKIVLFVLLTLTVGTLFGQNYLVSSTSDAPNFTVQITPSEFSKIVAFTPGFTWDGRLSIGLGIGKETSRTSSGSSWVIKPSVSTLVLKQGLRNNAVSVGISVSYQHNKFEDQDNLTAEIISLASSVYHEISVSKDIKLVPGAFVGWNNSNVHKDGRKYGGNSGFGFGFLFAARFRTFYVEPSFYYYEAAVFNLQFGFVFPTTEPS